MSQLLIKTIGTILNISSHIAPKAAIKKALDLFSTPRKGEVTDKQYQFLKTSEEKTIHYNKLPIHTYHWNTSNAKATILLVHGWESNSFRWKKLSKQLLKDGFNVIAIDAPAHGKSGDKTFTAIQYAAFINEVCKTYNPNHIVGHSVGGMASIFYLHGYDKTNISKLVSLGAPSEFDKIFLNYTNMMGYNKVISNGLDNYIFDKYGKYPSAFSSAKFSESIKPEGLIIHDIEDKIIPFSDAELIHKSYKNSTLIKTKGFGHGLKDQSVNDAIIAFLNK